MLNSLRARLVLWMVALEALLLVVLAGVSLVSMRNIQNRQIDQTLRLSAAELNAVVDVRGTTFDIPQQDSAVLRERGISAWVLTPQGQVAVTVNDGESMTLPADLPASGHYLDGQADGGEAVRIYRAPLTERQQTLGTMVLALSKAPVRAASRQVLVSLGIAIPFVLVLSAYGGLFLAGRALSPVSDITRTAQQISAADLGQRLDIDLPDDEIGQLARTFNAMLERLDEAFRRERQFTADASHELRTPLGMMKTQISLARSRPRQADELLGMMIELEGDVDRMTQLVETMLNLARVEQSGPSGLDTVDLNALLQSVVTELRRRAVEQHVDLSFAAPANADLRTRGDWDRLRQVFTNLIENGLKYTPAGGTIRVDVRRNWEAVVITIADTGMGILAEHLPHVFERFYRVDDARSRADGGFGLGLAISRAIIQVHQGRIDVASTPGQGTVVTVTLPGLRLG